VKRNNGFAKTRISIYCYLYRHQNSHNFLNTASKQLQNDDILFYKRGDGRYYRTAGTTNNNLHLLKTVSNWKIALSTKRRTVTRTRVHKVTSVLTCHTPNDLRRT